jgi:hypothetical protein
MARKQKQQPAAAPKNAADRAKAKAQKQKRLAIILGGVLLLVLVYEVPHTMKLMKHSASPVVVSSPGAAPAVTPTQTTTIPGGPPSQSDQQASAASPKSTIVASVQATPDPGQLTEFTKFASKDPFNASVQPRSGDGSSGSGGAGGTGGTGGSTPSGSSPGTGSTPKTPPAPAPTTAVISLNGEPMAVNVGSAFPVSGATFDRVGSLFQLVSLTPTSAKVSVVGGSYADGSNALTLQVGKAVTLQNTADGTKYTLILEPQGTAVPTSTTGTSTTPATTTTSPATTTPVVPSSP